MDILKLLKRGSDESPTLSLLSSDCVIEISKTYLLQRYATAHPPPANPHPALSQDGTLRIGLALSNLNGVDYRIPTRGGGTFTYTRYQDQFIRELRKQYDDAFVVWDDIRAKAVACGAFPYAFRVQDLIRNIVDYSSIDLDRSLWGDQPSTTFSYTDGGVFQNEPLGMAKNLVESLPNGHLNAEQRGYLLIAPQPKTSLRTKQSVFSAAKADFGALTSRLAEAVIGESVFQDWIMAENINDRLLLLDKYADQLQKLFLNGTLMPAQTSSITAALLAHFLTTSTQSGLINARLQLRQQYAIEYARFGSNIAAADAWLDLLLVLELAADLHEKEEMLIYDFNADPTLLAGGKIFAFEGFFDKSYRQHDYDYGRSVAHMRLQSYKNQAGNIFSELKWKPANTIRTINPHLNNLAITDIDKSKREMVCKQMNDAVSSLLEELGMPWLLRQLLMLFFLRGKIKAILAL